MGFNFLKTFRDAGSCGVVPWAALGTTCNHACWPESFYPVNSGEELRSGPHCS